MFKQSLTFCNLFLNYIFPVIFLKVVLCNCTALATKHNLNSTMVISTCYKNNSLTEFQLEKSNHEMNSMTMQGRMDRVFSVDSNIFEEYLKRLDMKIIPGRQSDDDFDNWIPPEEIKRDLPIYMSGFDRNNRPIWVCEYGRYKFNKYATGGRKLQMLFQKYFRYVAYNFVKSLALKSKKDCRVEQYIIFIDFGGLKPEDVLIPQVLQFQLKLISDYRRFSEKYAFKMVVLNVNLISESLLNFVRYFVVRFLDKMIIYGTNKAWWVPQLLKSFPQDQIPEQYGGNKGFQPLYIL